MKTFRWREGAPNPIRTAAGSTAKVRHAVPVVLDHKDMPIPDMRAVCGMRAKRGWQHTSNALPVCERCARAIAAEAYTEARP